MDNIFEIIKGRKSVRTFDGNLLSTSDREKLKEYIKTITNPFDIPVSFVLLDADKYGLSSPVLAGEKLYVAGKIEKTPYADVAFGYSFEELVLFAWSLGIGTVWIGGTMKRDLFEKAAELADGEMMPCMSPLGYPAKKRSLKEIMMRKGISADSRMPAEKLFFENSFNQPVSDANKEKYAYLIDAVRWAPSAVNKQPWRVVIADGSFHFYEKKDKGYISEKTGDLQKVDVGIAICHFVLGAQKLGYHRAVEITDPGISVPDNTEYIASVILS